MSNSNPSFFYKFRNITLLWKVIGTFDKKCCVSHLLNPFLKTYVNEDFQNRNIYFLKIALYNKKKLQLTVCRQNG